MKKFIDSGLKYFQKWHLHSCQNKIEKPKSILKINFLFYFFPTHLITILNTIYDLLLSLQFWKSYYSNITTLDTCDFCKLLVESS